MWRVTRRIVALRSPALRVPLWSLWFPLVLANAVLAVLVVAPERLIVPAFWRTALAAYLLGIDGVGA